MLTRSSLTIRLHPNDDVVIARAQLVGGTQLLDEKITVVGPRPARATRSRRARSRRASRSGATTRSSASRAATSRRASTCISTTSPWARSTATTRSAPTRSRRIRDRRRRRSWASSRAGRPRGDAQLHRHPVDGQLLGDRRARHRRPFHAASASPHFPNVDGVVALTHGSGCGMDTHGEGMQLLRRTLGGYARHAELRRRADGRPRLRGEPDQLAARRARTCRKARCCARSASRTPAARRRPSRTASGIIEEMLPHANDVTRQPVPASHITVGLQCGGSDGYSGITANPALGAAVDLLVRHGGTAILSETPEIYGAEHLLTRRAVSREVGEKLIARIKWWEDYTAREKGEMNNNPSPGNKAGGLTTILEKSLGAVAKGGTTNLVDVYEYAEPVTAKGFVYMDTPGYDPVSATGQVAGGAEHDRVHDRARLRLWLRAVAVAQAVDQHAAVGQAGRGHRPQLRRDRRRHRDASTRSASACSS